MGIMKEFESTSTLFGANAPFIEELYESYLADPERVSAEWRAYFDELRGGAADVAHAPVVASFVELARNRRVQGAMVDATTMHKQVLVLRLISKYRTLGMLNADLDPLKQHEPDYVADLDLDTYGFTDADMDTEFDVGSFKAGPARMRLRDIVQALQETYTRTLGAEYMYITDTATKRFFQERLEPIRSRPAYTPEQRRHILERLTAAETLERYLHTKYVGQKRFSGEGGDTIIPMLDRLIEIAGAAGVGEIVLGMAHRGRLNVLVNILGKMPAQLFSEFEGKAAQDLPAGDVKYHQGFSSDVSTPGGPVHLTLAFNPSHLEIVNPVVEGSVRARQHRRGDARGDQVLPILIHGDAAIAGPGRQPGMPQHGADPRLLHGRHHPHRHQQPDRLHDVRPARRARHDVLHRHRQDGRGAGAARQRRRPGGRACSRSRSRSSTASASTRTCSSTSCASAAWATTRPTSRSSRSRSCTGASRSIRARASSTRRPPGRRRA